MTTTILPTEGGVGMSLDHFIHQGIGADLSSLACHAAIELEGLLKGYSSRLDAIENLSKILSNKETTGVNGPVYTFLLDPSTSVVMNHAIVDSNLATELMIEDTQLISWTAQISKSLTKIATEAKTGQTHSDELIKMRSFCLALSQRASETEESAYEDDSASQWRTINS